MMRWLVFLLLVSLAFLWLLMEWRVLPSPVEAIVGPIVGLACMLAVPLALLLFYTAPGLFHALHDDVRHFWRRISTRRHDIDELQRKIAHLDKPYHMIQLGTLIASQGRPARAQVWFQRALEKDPSSIEARYKLALTHFDLGQYREAAELLEAVHQAKPDYDYGKAYLRLAQSQQRLGNASRASEIYEILLRYYPGHPEGAYHYALLLTEQNDLARARQLMQEVVFTVRHSPGFQRRRNRHWALKARWWLWRH